MIGEVDVVYQTRIRPERVRDQQELHRYAINSTVLQKMKPDALILHPLPRTVELDKTVDNDPRALYFKQAANGLYVRMALLTMLLEKNQSLTIISKENLCRCRKSPTLRNSLHSKTSSVPTTITRST